MVVFRLFCGKAVDVNVYITGESNVVLIINEDNLAGQMTAFSFINLKTKIEVA